MRRLIAAPFVLAALAVLISFALSNAQPATVGLWPTGLTLTLPLSVAILAAMAVAHFLPMGLGAPVAMALGLFAGLATMAGDLWE
jgi:hypothetical protein